LSLVHGDVLEAHADALIVPIDGTMVPRPGHTERLLGNIGRALVRRFAEADIIDELEAQLELPLALGRAAVIHIAGSGARFGSLVVVSTLHHADTLDAARKRALVSHSLTAALDVAARAQLGSLATAVLQGGWRLSAEVAFQAMLDGWAAAPRQAPDLAIHTLDAALVEHMKQLARSLGF
jgi:hypothetical protein